jgi:uncharacterized protein
VQQRLTLVTVGVRDLAVSRRFYLEGLGWTPTLDVPEVVFLQVGHGVLLALFDRDALDAEAGQPPSGASPAGFALSCNVGSEAEVDDGVRRFVAAGGTVLRPPHRASWGGWIAYVADPDGVRWEIAHNPDLAVAADGTVRLGGVPG